MEERDKSQRRPRKELQAKISDGVSVWGECGGFSVYGPMWRAWLNIAQAYGWKPAGTLPPKMEFNLPEFVTGNDGGYYAPYEGQRITCEDAVNLGRALSRALTDIPDVPEAQDLQTRFDGGQSLRFDDGWPDPPRRKVLEQLAPGKPFLKPFIRHCLECSEFWLY